MVFPTVGDWRQALRFSALRGGCVVALLAGGCTLIDQRTFERAGKSPDAAALARADLPPTPLLSIRFDNPDIDVRTPVSQAVEAVEGVKPDAQYDVVFPIPTSATQNVQDTFAKLGADATARVVSALGYAGVAVDHVHVSYRGDTGAPPVEVSVYVR